MVGLSPAALGQSDEKALANVSGGGSSVRFDVTVANSGSTLTVTAPDGRAYTKEYKAGISPEFTFTDKQGLPDGVYTYELRLRPSLSAGQREALKAARGNDDDPESDRAARKRPAAGAVQSGSFAIMNGQVVVAGLSENGRIGKADVPSNSTVAKTAAVNTTSRFSSGNTVNRLRNHRTSLSSYLFDFVIADDLIVQGSACVGLDCVDGESFNFDTIRTKENNVRISFNDTSTSAGFPTEDWTIRANSSSSGGGNFLAFVDRGTNNSGDESGTIVFEVDAGAPANSLRVSSGGKIGVRTATPVLDVHVNSTDTPALRMEQNNSGGFTAQTWDIGANEANFFVRDVTSGSRLPLRIRPGAPTSSLDISNNGNVGIGTASPGVTVDIQAASGNGVIRVKPAANLSAQISLLDNGGSANARGWGISTNDAVYGNFKILQSNAQGGDPLAGSARMTIDPSGNVGIGTTSPDQKLSVQGDADKSAGGTSWGVFSDERLKDIKGSYSRGLSAVMGLRPVRFSYKKENALALPSGNEIIGFSAQALEKLVPEAVTKNANGYLVVHSDPILWAMLNAIQEQQREIASLKAQVKKLRRGSRQRHK
jgi:hypothetical protein